MTRWKICSVFLHEGVKTPDSLASSFDGNVESHVGPRPLLAGSNHDPELSLHPGTGELENISDPRDNHISGRHLVCWLLEQPGAASQIIEMPGSAGRGEVRKVLILSVKNEPWLSSGPATEIFVLVTRDLRQRPQTET